MLTAAGNEFGQVLRKMREKRGFTLRDLQAKTGVFHSNISGIEAGRVHVGPKIFDRLARAVTRSESETLEMSIAFTAARMRQAGSPIKHLRPEAVMMMTDIMQNSGIDVGGLQNLELVEFPGGLFGNSFPRKVWFACERGAKPLPNKKGEIMNVFMQTKHKRGLLLVVSRKNGRVCLFQTEEVKLA